jgi:Protein of unknown function (DUF3147)
MTVSANLSALKRANWSEYVVRFLFGGAASLLAMILAKRFGPAVGGLFLAFPAIFPASATLIEKHETRKKRAAGILNTVRGRQAAALDAAGAVLGSIGLAGFALIIWRMLSEYGTGFALFIATLTWLALAMASWTVWKKKAWIKVKSKRASER